MLKIVVFDSGYGGEVFADCLKEAFPLAEIIRVIDWRNAEEFVKSRTRARRAAKEALRPYFGRVDLIILANYYLSITSLKYFERSYQNQKFLGLKLPQPDTFIKRPITILTTKSLSRTANYHNYLFRLKRKTNTICLDHWLPLIDDGELTEQMILEEFENFYQKHRYKPTELTLACSHFNDIVPILREKIDKNLKIHDGFEEAIRNVGKILKIRGGTVKKRKK